MAPERKTDYIVKSVDSALELLLAFERAPHRFGISELARMLSMSRNQAFRLVKTLEERGFLVKDDQHYMLGLGMVNLVSNAKPGNEIIRQAARPIMQDVTNRTGETTYLMVRAGRGKVLCIEVVESSALVRSVPPVGQETPHLGGAAKVLLTFSDPDYRQWVLGNALVGLSEASQRQQIRDIALNHYSITTEEYAADVDALGVPIWDRSGTVVAALGLVGPSSRLRARLRSDLPRTLLEAAKQISSLLAGDPDVLPEADLTGL